MPVGPQQLKSRNAHPKYFSFIHFSLSQDLYPGPHSLSHRWQKRHLKVSAGKSVLFSGNTQDLSGVIGSCMKGKTRKKAQQSIFKFLESHQSPDLITLGQEIEKGTFIPGALAPQVSELLGNSFFPLNLWFYWTKLCWDWINVAAWL